MRTLIVSTLLLASAGLAAPDAAAQYYGGGSEQVVRCESNDGRWRQCPLDVRGGVRLARQVSKSPCIEGHSWGVDRNGLWVSHGCRADFVLGYDGGDYVGGYGDRVVRCESTNSRSRHCAADTRGGVELVRQFSRNACIRGESWGWDERGIWVTGGCRGEFRTMYGDWSGTGPDPRAQIVRCESRDGRPRMCPVETRGGVRLVRQLSRTPCIEGQSWGRNRDGIWVERGCRADFEVGYRRDRGWGWGRR